jgi:hypothetical protein
MRALDGDSAPLRARNGASAYRDIVQFVAFRDFPPSDPGSLAAAVLAELPGQVVRHFTLAGFRPVPMVAPTLPPPAPQ